MIFEDENGPPSRVRQIPPVQEAQLRVTVVSQRARLRSRHARVTIFNINNT